MNLKEFIENLSPELQEKAYACGSPQELMALTKEAGVPLPDEVLAAIVGGEAGSKVKDEPVKCPFCGSTDTVINYPGFSYKCLHCGSIWTVYGKASDRA